jgi:hypothetical protein
MKCFFNTIGMAPVDAKVCPSDDHEGALAIANIR